MDIRPVIERELSAWAAARKELTLAQRLAVDDPQSRVHEARVQRASEAVRETIAVLRAAMDARGVSREQLQEVMRAS
jgi:hypothetical protein